MNELVLLESRTARQDRLADVNDDRALETINKAKALLMATWQGTSIATTAQMAEYYEVPEKTIQTVVRRNREELASDGLKTLKGKALQGIFIMKIPENGTTVLTIWTPRAAIRLGMLLRDSAVAKQVRSVLLDVAEQQPQTIGILTSTFETYDRRLTAIEQRLNTPQYKALPKASVDPVPGEITPMTERQCINRVIRSYVYRKNKNLEGSVKTEQEISRWMYRELKYRHSYDIEARYDKTKYKSKIAQIEAEGYLPQLHAICNHFLGQ